MTRNIVLICLDSVRKDTFDSVAHRLGERMDISFTGCRAASGWSVPSHASMFTGLLPHEHGIHAHHRDFSGLSRADTFLDDIPHHAALVSSNVYASSAFGFDRIFDASTDISPKRRFPAGLDVTRFGQEAAASSIRKYAAFARACLGHAHPWQSFANGVLVQLDDLLTAAPVPKPIDDGASVVSRAARNQVRAAPEPFFLFCNYMDAHGPLTSVLGYDRQFYSAPHGWSSKEIDPLAINDSDDLAGQDKPVAYYRELYRAAIDYLDRNVSTFVDWVLSNTSKETTVIITADHGENLGYRGDGGLFEHSYGLTEALLHVPLAAVNAPPGSEGEVSGLVTHLDLGHLIVNYAGGEYSHIVREEVPAERVGSNINGLAEMEPAKRLRWDPMIRCVYVDNSRLQWDSLGSTAEYRIDPARPSWQEESPGRHRDVDAYEDLEARHFTVPIGEYKDTAVSQSAEEESPDLDDATRDRLEDLGYL